MSLITPGDRKCLPRALGKTEAPASVVPKPAPSRPESRWDRNHGDLFVGNQVARKVRVCGTATRLQMILDASEAAGWPSAISQPFGHCASPVDARAAAHELNNVLPAANLADHPTDESPDSRGTCTNRTQEGKTP